MGSTLVGVDAFTSKPFAGNPAAVCVLSRPADAGWMQQLAQEMNLSETAFLIPHEGGYDLRWFTPTVEVDLCGHATLASAHALWEIGLTKRDTQIRFHTKSGVLTADWRASQIWLDFPARTATEAPAPEELSRALGVNPVWSGANGLDYLVEVESEATLRGIRPDFGLLRTTGLRGVIVTSRADSPDYDFVSRYFAPGSGIDEDPVTGSAHCALGPFWAPRLGKQELVGYQASARGGVVAVNLVGERVHLGGTAVTVWRGELA